jgi:glycosyltransferase involved in cell wall biosynthesis
LSRAHLLVQPSLVQNDGDTEGLPNTLQEAAATGVTMVGTRVAGVPELVEDGASGFLAEPGSAPSLAAALLRAMSAGRAVRALQQDARQRMEADHDLNKVAAALVIAFSAHR